MQLTITDVWSTPEIVTANESELANMLSNFLVPGVKHSKFYNKLVITYWQKKNINK